MKTRDWFGNRGNHQATALLFVSALLATDTALAAAIHPQTLEEAEQYSAEELELYRQERYQRVDPVGDLAIMKRASLIPARALRKFRGLPQLKPPADHREAYELDQDTAAESDSTPPDGISIQGRDGPIFRAGFHRMLIQVINEERTRNGIEPSLGTPHAWSPEFLRRYRPLSYLLLQSKLFSALMVGDTQKFLRTDREGDLYRWIFTQPKNSVLPPELFRKSYQLNHGDLYLTLLTIENVLAHNWRHPEREKLPLTQQLKPITSGYQYNEDRFGTWYHLFGIMLYGYVEGGVKGNLVGRFEAFGSRIAYPETVKTQKAWINRVGGLIGGDLARSIRSQSYLQAPWDPEALREDTYLNRTEDFRDRLPVTLDPTIAASVTSNAELTMVWVRNLKQTLRGCTVEVMPDLGGGFDNRLKETVPGLSIGPEFVGFRVFVPGPVRRVRGFIQCSENDSGTPETIRVFESDAQ